MILPGREPRIGCRAPSRIDLVEGTHREAAYLPVVGSRHTAGAYSALMDTALRKLVTNASVEAEARGAPREIVAALEDALVVLAVNGKNDPAAVAAQVAGALRRWEEWLASAPV